MNVLPGLYPGVVESYDAARRQCRVAIPGITDGSDVRPLAVFLNPLGDRPQDTEIRILPGDLVWLAFEEGDPRFPVIMGYRTPRAGSQVGWRRWRHANIQLTAENTFLITVGDTTVTITDGTMAVAGADLTVTGNITSGKSITAAEDIRDQAGGKSMAGMRQAYNQHQGHNPPGATPNHSM